MGFIKRAARKFGALLLVGLVASCAVLSQEKFEAWFGESNPARFDAPVASSAISYREEVQPILERRCVVCHACYDAPCQLKLTAWEGLARGASQVPVYDGTRLFEADPTRLFTDAQKTSEWRGKGFFPVLNEYADRSVGELQASLLARSIELKRKHPQAFDNLDFSLDRTQQCAPVETYDEVEQRNPSSGMPFGLPALKTQEWDTIKRWLRMGAPYEGPHPLSQHVKNQIAHWETFFNGHSLREQLVNRYIYEHLFLAHLYFEDDDHRQYFQLVRSLTPPGQALREVATRRPFDDPGVARIYYRLRPVGESIVAKSHMPYALSASRMQRWRTLFYATSYTVDALPSYAAKDASNPFETFYQLPVASRYRFMLDEAQYTVMGFIKGPVCRGQTALNVINDHFWVVFQNPDTVTEKDAGFLRQKSHLLDLPAAQGSNAFVLGPWLRYARQEQAFLQSRSAYYEKRFDRPDKVTLDLVWDGEGRNPNAALTVYRHFDSATVLKGLVGEMPKTTWVLSYSLLERIHYLLVAGYDVYGNVGHQLNTRLYMDFLRMEAESNFLMMLPLSQRIAVRDAWYRGASQEVKDHVYGKYAHFNRETGIAYPRSEPVDRALMGLLQKRLSPVSAKTYDLSQLKDPALENDLQSLARVRGRALSWLPEASVLRVVGLDQRPRDFTLVRNTAHLNITYLLNETKGLIPEENSLDVLRGIATAYPNAFYRVSHVDLPAFIQQLKQLTSNHDYAALFQRFGVDRMAPDFWELSDSVYQHYQQAEPIEAGILDLSRLEGRRSIP